MQNIIQKRETFFKEVNVVMLNSDKKPISNSLIKYSDINGKTTLGVHNFINSIFYKNNSYYPQHIYITSNDAIKENDWYIDEIGAIRKSVTSDEDYWSSRKHYHKIIATTNFLVIKNDCQFSSALNHLPNIPQEFIKIYIDEFNSNDMITKALVEFELGFNGTRISGTGIETLALPSMPKVSADKNIYIKPLETKLYSKKDILKIFKDSGETGGYIPHWISKNL